jgi:hypothetical protein
VGAYFAELTNGSSQSLGAVSAKMDQFGWDGGWRINDSAQRTLWLASDGAGTWLWEGTPFVFVVNTITMEIVASETDGSSVDALSVVQNIDNNY